MPPFTVCPDCGTPAPAAACNCPSCGLGLRSCKRGAGPAALLLGLSLVACGDKENVEPPYGVPDSSYGDQDGDGYSEQEGDCADADPNIHPDATETPGDTIDSNCDGSDDT